MNKWLKTYLEEMADLELRWMMLQAEMEKEHGKKGKRGYPPGGNTGLAGEPTGIEGNSFQEGNGNRETPSTDGGG